MDANLAELARHLQSRRSEIVDRWMRLCEADEILDVVSRLTRTEFRDGIPDTIDEFCRVLTQGDVDRLAEAIQSDSGRHGHHRWKQGFDLVQVVRDWGCLNQELLRVIDAFFEYERPGDPNLRSEALALLAQFISEATTGSIRRFDELRRAEATSVAEDIERMKVRFEALTEARGQLLREAAHDIRGGLSVVAMASDLLRESEAGGGGTNDSFAAVLDRLDRGVESVKGMLNALLDLSRLESGVEELDLLSVDIAAVLKALAAELELTAAQKGLLLELDGPDEMFVQTDPRKVRRITQNLLLNALQHTSSGEVRLAWALDSKRWSIRVSDTGSGIEHIVGPAVARELDRPDSHPAPPASGSHVGYRGEGIGLTIVKRLCSLLRAGISLESEVGRGTVFSVEFPLTYAD